jgi:hypothetical protein
MEKPDFSYLMGLGALWLSAVATALHAWLAWGDLPPRMATHFDAHSHANGWTTRADAVTLCLGMLGGALVVLTVACYLVRRLKPSNSWPVLIISYLVAGVIAIGSNSILSYNVAPHAAETAPR